MKELSLGYYTPYIDFLRHLKDEGNTFRLVRDTARKELHIAVFDKDKNKRFHWEIPYFMDEALLIKNIGMPYLSTTQMNDYELYEKEIK